MRSSSVTRRSLFVLSLVLAVALAASAAHADVGCPVRMFPEPYTHNCVPVARANHLPLHGDQPMRFQALAISPMIGWIQATGVITKNTPLRFERFLKSPYAKGMKLVELNSPGGNLMAGLKLGTMIRRAGLNTAIGRSLDLQGSMEVFSYPKSYCMSACAYAFLGGVTRSYGAQDLYGVHRFGAGGGVSGTAAQVVSSVIAAYVRSMGVDVSVLELASSASFKHDVFLVPVPLAKKLRIIYDPSGWARFVVHAVRGAAVADFKLREGARFYRGVVACVNGERRLALFDVDNSIPQPLRAATDFPAEFKTPDGEMTATATYLAANKQRPAVMVFTIPGLRAVSFEGAGLSLTTISNPSLPSLHYRTNRALIIDKALADRLTWGDAVMEFSFGIRSNNAANTLPLVLRGCR